MSNISFVCPQCGNKTFKVASEPARIEDFDGAVCTSCGHTISEADIKRQAMKEAEKLIKAALGKHFK